MATTLQQQDQTNPNPYIFGVSADPDQTASHESEANLFPKGLSTFLGYGTSPSLSTSQSASPTGTFTIVTSGKAEFLATVGHVLGVVNAATSKNSGVIPSVVTANNLSVLYVSATGAVICGGIATLATSARIAALVNEILTATGPAKCEAQKSAVTTFLRTGGSVSVLDQIVRSLIFSRRSGAIDDAIDLLALVGRETVRSLARYATYHLAQDSVYKDYWYSVIRAAGRVGDRETIAQFLISSDFAIQEAVVEALYDLGDSEAFKSLRSIGHDRSRPESIRDLALELASDIA